VDDVSRVGGAVAHCQRPWRFTVIKTFTVIVKFTILFEVYCSGSLLASKRSKMPAGSLPPPPPPTSLLPSPPPPPAPSQCVALLLINS